KEKMEECNKLLTKKSELQGKVQEKEDAYNRFKILKEKQNQLLQLEKQANQLQTQETEISKKKETLKSYRKAMAFIKPIFLQLRERELELEKYEVSFKECSRWKSDYEERVMKLESEELKLITDQGKKGEREAKI